MKKTFLVLTLSSALYAAAQPAETRPAAPTAPSGLPASPTTPGLPGSPAAPGLPASPAASGLAGFTNAGGILSFTNQFGTNLLPADLAPLLTALQNDLEQLLPVLAQVNNNFSSLPGLVSPTSTSIGVPTTGVNLSGNSSVDISSARGANASANLSTPVATTTALGTNAAAGSLIPPSATGSSNVIGLPPGTTPAAAGTNFFMTPAALDTLNALIILQNDVQRMLPVVANLNGSGIKLPQLGSGSATNRLTPAPSSRVLTPGQPPATQRRQ